MICQQKCKCLLAGQYITLSLQTSHNFLPFSKIFLPSLKMKVASKDDNLVVMFAAQQMPANKWDLGDKTRIIYRPEYKDKYGCQLQMYNYQENTHASIIVCLNSYFSLRCQNLLCLT